LRGQTPGPPPADVVAAEPTGPVDAVDRGVGAAAREANIAAERGDSEHPATVGEEPVTGSARAGMEDLDLRVACRGVEAADLASPLRVSRIAVRRHDDAEHAIGMPTQGDRL